jgi:3-isopropylmalate/(R)-2-methylmalate dehydratase small subunit
MRPFTTLTSRAALLPADDIDTDQIIPARFLTTTERSGLGAHLFADWSGPPFEAAGAEILVTGRNFGCGSSREHAAWALLDAGFKAVVAPTFGDIFTANALKNGLLPIRLADHEHGALVAALRDASAQPITITLASQAVELTGAGDALRFIFPIDPFAKHCLLEGIDQLGYLLAAESEIAEYERRNAIATGAMA